jgi:hypothetical protein
MIYPQSAAVGDQGASRIPGPMECGSTASEMDETHRSRDDRRKGCRGLQSGGFGTRFGAANRVRDYVSPRAFGYSPIKFQPMCRSDSPSFDA